MLEIYQGVAAKLAECDDKIGGDWDETDAGLGNVILSERAYVRAVMDKWRNQT